MVLSLMVYFKIELFNPDPLQQSHGSSPKYFSIDKNVDGVSTSSSKILSSSTAPITI